MAKSQTSKPRILVTDIETVPGTAYVWDIWNPVPLGQLIEAGRPVCAAWQWLGESAVHFDAEWKHKDPTHWLKAIHKALSAADAVVTYNGKKFDLPKLNGLFIKAKLKPLPAITHIDLFQFVKRNMGLISNKLEVVAVFLDIGSKMKHEGFRLWKGVMAGLPGPRTRMERYNKQDVRLTTRAYKRLRTYIPDHPHIHMHGACPVCGSFHIGSNGWRRTRTMKYKRLQCLDCGHTFKGKGQRL